MFSFINKGERNKLISELVTMVLAAIIALTLGTDAFATGNTKKIPFGNDIPIVGTIKGADDKELYVVDISEYEPEDAPFEYKVVTGKYMGVDYTFMTDQARNIRIVYTLDENKNPILYAYSENDQNLYPIENFNFGEGEVYITSLKAILNVPEGVTDDIIGSNTVFYSIDKDGNGGVYRYTTEGKLISWGSKVPFQGDADNKKTIHLFRIIIAVLGGLIIIAAIAFLLKKASDPDFGVSKKDKTRKKKNPDIEVESRPESTSGKAKQYIFVIRELTEREIKRKYVGSKLGILWSILNPLLMMVVMSMIFSFMFKRSIENFPLYYLAGNLVYSLFSEITNHTMSALVDNKSLLIKTKLPLQIFILSRAYTALVNYAYSLIPFAVMLFIFKIKPATTMLMIIPGTMLVLIMAIGISYMLSTAYVFFEDVKYLYSGVFLRILMYLSAVFYPVTSLPDKLQKLISLNPVYMGIYITRECMVYGRFPHYTAWIKLSVAAAVCFVGGMIIFSKNQNKIMQRI